jgi:hypothetical protein
MLYIVTICYPEYQKILIEGPKGFPIRDKFTELRKEFDEYVGIQPNVLCFGDHTEWVANRLQALQHFREIYGTTGELEDIFIKMLEDNHGFRRLLHTEIFLP